METEEEKEARYKRWSKAYDTIVTKSGYEKQGRNLRKGINKKLRWT